ncbi:MAG: NrdJb [Gammaproteobacteria bacterium]
MHERVERPDVLVGSTYKIKTPLSEHALYVTINDIVLNHGTEHEQRRPFEVFINSKNMEHFQWIVALTRIISAVFRKGGDVTFLVDELRSVFDPRGGYFKRGGRYMPSLVAEIGDAIEAHLRSIGLIKGDGLSETQRGLIERKRAEHAAATRNGDTSPAPADVSTNSNPQRANHDQLAKHDESEHRSFPPEARFCSKCAQRSVIQMDGCMTCLSCGDSKCG